MTLSDDKQSDKQAETRGDVTELSDCSRSLAVASAIQLITNGAWYTNHHWEVVCLLSVGTLTTVDDLESFQRFWLYCL